MLSRAIVSDAGFGTAAPAHAAHNAREEMRQPTMLLPVSHPQLAPIPITDSLFAIGRTEPPFAGYPADVVADLSRRHARMFTEVGAIYLADLGSKNGTMVNGVAVRQKIVRLQAEDVICFGRTLCYRLQPGNDPPPARATRLSSVTLTPEHDDAGLQAIVITEFPFLISKTDPVFAQYRAAQPDQVNYLSRRHAHIFLKGELPHVEDLGSTNGTFVNGVRLDEHARALQEGDRLGFGGYHFAYVVGLQQQAGLLDPTVTMLSAGAGAPVTADPERTTFVDTAGSFLDIFCIDPPAAQDDDAALVPGATPALPAAPPSSPERQPRRVFPSLRAALASVTRRRTIVWIAAGTGVLVALMLAISLGGSPERDLQTRIANGDYPGAAALAREALAHSPDDAALRALGTEAVLKAGMPRWLGALEQHDATALDGAVAAMRAMAANNPDLQELLRELDWLGALEQFIASRGGVAAPLRLYVDEARIRNLLQRWEDDTPAHQRRLARIATLVPAFRDPYAQALSHLRKLDSDDTVYLAAMDRLKAAVETALQRDEPAPLEALLKDTAEKYPRIGGLDPLRRDLANYLRLDNALRGDDPAAVLALLTQLQWTTPPFQQKLQALGKASRLPPADLIAHHRAAASAWQAGQAEQALTAWKALATGRWGQAATLQLKQKQAIVDSFAALQKTQPAGSADDLAPRALAFYNMLDPEQDQYFLRAAETSLGLDRQKLLIRASEQLQRAVAHWQRYREGGAITPEQRIAQPMSAAFSSRARLLAEADANAQQSAHLYRQMQLALPDEAQRQTETIHAEVEQQRRAVQSLQDVLSPAQLQAELNQLGGK